MILKSLRDNVYLAKYRQLSGEESERYLRALLNCTVPQKAFLAAYNEVEPIEKMGKRETLDMYRYVVGLFPEKSNPEKRMICKVLYIIGNLL